MVSVKFIHQPKVEEHKLETYLLLLFTILNFKTLYEMCLTDVLNAVCEKNSFIGESLS